MESVTWKWERPSTLKCLFPRGDKRATSSGFICLPRARRCARAASMYRVFQQDQSIQYESECHELIFLALPITLP